MLTTAITTASAVRVSSAEVADPVAKTPTGGQDRRLALARGKLHGVRYQDTFITADGRVTQDPAEAVRIDRDWYDDGQLVRREWFHAAPSGQDLVPEPSVRGS